MLIIHTIILFQVFLDNTNNFQTSFLFIDGPLTGTTTQSQSGPESNDNEE